MTTQDPTTPFSLRTFIQRLLTECRDEFDEEDSLEKRLRIVCSKPESLTVGGLVHREEAWPRKNEELSKRNREDGNTAYQDGRFELAILLYTEAMKYAPCNPVLLEGEALALAAANRSAAYYQQGQYREAVEDVEEVMQQMETINIKQNKTQEGFEKDEELNNLVLSIIDDE